MLETVAGAGTQNPHVRVFRMAEDKRLGITVDRERTGRVSEDRVRSRFYGTERRVGERRKATTQVLTYGTL